MLIELLESRALMSASVSQIQADFAALNKDAKAVKNHAVTLVADLDSIPAGTKGLNPLKKRVDAFVAAGASVVAGTGTYLNSVVADQGNASAEATDLANLQTYVKNSRASLKVYFEAVETVVAKHPTLITSGNIPADFQSFFNDWTTFKTDFKTTKADL